MGSSEGNVGPLYREVRGSGPVVLMIPGIPGDGGQFDEVARALSTRRTVVTYDRRGSSRSPSGPSSGALSVQEHADDAAGLIDAIGQPVFAYGNSLGAAVALELAVRHPDSVRGVALHEMPLFSVLPEEMAATSGLGQAIARGMAEGGAAGGLEAMQRFVFGDDVVQGLDPVFRGRAMANPSLAMSELATLRSYRPDERMLSAMRVPAYVLLRGEGANPSMRAAATWLAEQLGTHVRSWPGAHGPQYTCPAELADAIVSLDEP